MLGGWLAPPGGFRVSRAADGGEEGAAVRVDERLEAPGLEAAAECAASDAAQAEARRLLGREHHRLDGMPEAAAGRAEHAEGLDRAEHADDAVVLAGERDGVRVRTAEHGRKRWVGALETAVDVPDRILAHREAGLAHEVLDEVARLDVALGEQDARHRRGGIIRKQRELLDLGYDGSGVQSAEIHRIKRRGGICCFGGGTVMV